MAGLDKRDYEISTISQQFWRRVGFTNIAYDELFDENGVKKNSSGNDIDDRIKNIMYFSYYFDISTAIESLLRGIAFKLAETKKYVDYYTKPHDKGKGYFISIQELETFVVLDMVSSIFSKARIEAFKSEAKKISPLKKYTQWNRSFDSIDFFRNVYTSCVDQRNLFAHGLMQQNPNATADYTRERILYFIYLYYFFCEFYKQI